MKPTIIDNGRGPQLSTNRITVQDLYPYFQIGRSHKEIRDAMPILTDEEINIVAGYIDANRAAIEEQDKRIRDRSAGQRNPASVEKILRQARKERLERVNSVGSKTMEQGRENAAG